jgi:hypothetical protein
MQEIKSSQKLKWWPSPQDYNEAVQNPRTNLADVELKAATVVTDALGLPRPMTGAFASVYRLSAPTRDVALRCFLRNTSDHEERYKLISEFVSKGTLPYTVTFDFLREGIRINGSWFPVLKMEWAHGATLDAYVHKHLENEQPLQDLVDRFLKMCADLRAAGIAHGDLQHGNILVKDGEFKLVDYDGMFVPGMGAFFSNELGHPNYQHPARESRHFGPYLDNFSAWVIFVSLQSIALDPTLFGTLAAGDDCLLFRRDDFLHPLHSHAFWVLENHERADIVRMARFLRWQLKCDPKDVPPLASGTFEVLNLPPVNKPIISRTSVAVARGASEKVLDDGDNSPLPEWVNGALAGAAAMVRTPNMPSPMSAQAPAPQQFLHPALEPELRIPLPRHATRNNNCGRHNPWTVQLMMLLNPLVWAMLFYATITIPADRAFINSGVDYPAVILSKQKVEGKDAHFEVGYKFDVKGEVNFRTGKVSLENGANLAPGESMVVRVLPSNPSIVEPLFFPEVQSSVDIAQRRLGNDEAVLLTMALINLVIELLIWAGPLKHRQLVRFGHPAVATVMSLRTQNVEDSVRFFVEYSFNSPHGRIMGCEKVHDVQYNTLQLGDKVSVLYDPANPQRNILYGFSFYKALP